MRIEVACEKQQLEEQHAGRPDRRGATEPRKHALADDRLHLKDKEGAEQRRGGKPEDRLSWSGRPIGHSTG